MSTRDLQAEASKRVQEFQNQRQKLVELIKKQEPLASQNPAGYRRKVILFAGLGYGYILVVLLVLIALLVGLVWVMIASDHIGTGAIKIGIFLFIIIATIVRSLFITIPAPKGRRVSRTEAPKLWQEVDTLSQSLGSPKVDEIIVNLEMNAAAAQRPRFGFFGGNKNYLLLGLPLMHGLPTEEMRSVIAHEFGHFSGQHGKTGGRIYRLNQSFARIQTALHQSSANLLFRGFYDWFQPRFDAISFVLRRQNEYEADAAAVRVAGSSASRALMRLSYLGRSLDEGVWDKLGKLVKEQPAPPKDAFNAMPQMMAAATETLDLRTLVQNELEDKTGYEDTHPCLTDRLRAMGALPHDPDAALEELKKSTGESSAEFYIGPFLPDLVRYFNEDYAKQITGSWLEQYRGHKEGGQKLIALRAKQEEGALSRAEQIDLGFLVLRLEDPKDALPIFQTLLDAKPDDAEAMFGLGEAKLAVGEADGEDLLRASTRLNASYLEPAVRKIVDFRQKSGKFGSEDLQKIKDEFHEQFQAAGIVKRERLYIKPTDEFTSSSLDPAQRAELAEQLRARGDIRTAFLVAKIIRMGDAQRHNILILEPMSRLTNEEKNKQLTQKVLKEVSFPSAVTVLTPVQIKPWKTRFKSIGDAVLYKR